MEFFSFFFFFLGQQLISIKTKTTFVSNRDLSDTSRQESLRVYGLNIKDSSTEMTLSMGTLLLLKMCIPTDIHGL